MANSIIEKFQNQHDTHPSICGQSYALCVSFGNSQFFGSVKLLKQRHPVPYCNYYCGTLFIITVYILSVKLKVPLFRSDNYQVQNKLFLRGILGAIGFVCLTTSASLIPIKLIGVLMATNCLWGLLFDAFVVGTKVTKTMVMLAFLAFTGIILVVNPAFVLEYFGVDYSSSDNETVKTYIKDFMYYFGVLIGLTGGLVAVIINWLLADLAKLINPIQSSFYAIISFTMTGAFFIFFVEDDGPWLLEDYFYLIIYYLSLCLLQYCIFYCNKYEKRQSYLSIFINFQVVWNFISAYQIFDDVIYISNIVGSQIVVICGFFILSSKEKLSVKEIEEKQIP